MKHFKLIPLVVAIAALSACHQGGVGVDSGASQKAATGSENGLRSDRSITAHTAAAASIQMPAAPLMVSALTDLAKREYLPPKSAAAASGPMAGIDIRSLIWSGAMQAPLGVPASALTGKPSPSGSKTGDGIDAQTAQVFGLLPIAASAYPWQGWPFSCFGCAKEGAWARGMARQIIYSNTILTQLYPSLGTQALADPAAARAAVQAAWKKLPAATILAAWKEAGDQVKEGGINFDFTGSGPAPIHFMIGNNDFQGSPTGWKWSQAGVVWFGDGAISGKQTMLGLESAIDKSAGQTSGTGTSTGTSTEQGAGGSAGVK